MTELWRGAAPVLLASKSRARRSLLATIGVPFDSCDSLIDEREIEAPLRSAGAGGAEIGLHLARAKALAVSARGPDRLVIGADQTLCLEGQVLSKPSDQACAVTQLEALSGRTHELHSALCIARGNRIVFEAVPSARLKVRRLSRAFIETYVALAGKAVLTSVGAYQIEGLGIHLFDEIEGDHSTILGLPLLPLLTYLREEGSLLG